MTREVHRESQQHLQITIVVGQTAHSHPNSNNTIVLATRAMWNSATQFLKMRSYATELRIPGYPGSSSEKSGGRKQVVAMLSWCDAWVGAWVGAWDPMRADFFLCSFYFAGQFSPSEKIPGYFEIPQVQNCSPRKYRRIQGRL